MATMLKFDRRYSDSRSLPAALVEEAAADMVAAGQEMRAAAELLYGAFWTENAQLHLHGCGRLDIHGKQLIEAGRLLAGRVSAAPACPDGEGSEHGVAT